MKTRAGIFGAAIATAGGLTIATGTMAADAPSAGTGAFYGASVTAVAAFLLFHAALRNRIGLLYAVLFAAMLGLIWTLEGGLFRLLPQLGETPHRVLTMVIALACCAFGFYTAAQACDPVRIPNWIRRALRDLSVVSLVLMLGTWFWPYGAMALAINGLLVVMFAGHAVAAFGWRTLSGKPFRLPAVTAALLFVTIFVLFILYGSDGAALEHERILRWLFALVTLPTMVAAALAVLDLRRSHDRTLEEAATLARKEAAQATALVEMERNYGRARDAAARRRQQLASATHDIRQLIAALRSELDMQQEQLAPGSRERFDQILSHFDRLTTAYTAPGEPSPSGENQTEDVPAALLFGTLDRLFTADARASGIELRFIASRTVFRTSPVALMRIASNLLGNAITHADGTRILVGVRRGGERCRLEIHDNGRGFPSSGVEAAMEAGAKGEGSAGSGLGLSIVRDLADANGYALRFRTESGRGTVFSISVPTRRTP